MGKVLSAQGSGYFPSCIINDPTGFKITGSLQDIMSLYWRVKKFKVSVSGNGIFNEENQIPCSFSGETELQTVYRNGFYPQPSITDEASLVCNYNFRDHEHLTGSGLSYTITSEGGSESGNARMEMRFQTAFSRPSESTYAMRFQFRLDERTLFYLRIFSVPSDYDVGSWSVNLFGTTIVGRAYSQEGSIISGDFNIDFTATEYWSYGGTYDTTTGAPL